MNTGIKISTGNVTRRDFLKTSATVAAATAFGSLDLTRSAHAAGSDIIKVGLIGCGLRGTAAAIDALDADPGVELTAMSDLFSDKIEASLAIIRQSHPNRAKVPMDRRFTGFDGYRQVIVGCDVVLIACASRFHPYYLRAAVDAGKHVFVEKPHGIDPVGVRATRDACILAKTKGLSVLSGLHNRFNTCVKETVQRIHDGAIGEVLSLEVNFLRAPYVLVERQPGWREIEYQCRNWYHFSWLSGDDVTQSLVHSLDKAYWVMRDDHPITAHGLGGRSASFGPIYGDVFDHHSVVYEFPSGVKVYAFCRTQKDCHDGTSDYIVGTKGRASLLIGKITGENTWKFAGNVEPPYKVEQREFFKAIRAGVPINCGDYMVNSTMTAVMGQMVCYNGRKLGWPKLANSLFAFPPQGPYDFNIKPPVQPGADGQYPVPAPGRNQIGIDGA